MIKPEELRVGNLVINKQRGLCRIYGINKEIVQVDVVESPHDGSIMLNHYEIDPVPLTEDILLKAGFIKSSSQLLYFKPIPALDMEIQSTKFRGEYVIELNNDTKPIVTEAKHLHQLQNLYFALTGEELTINF